MGGASGSIVRRVNDSTQRFPELGFYTLAGQPDSSRDIVQEMIDGEAMGFAADTRGNFSAHSL